MDDEADRVLSAQSGTSTPLLCRVKMTAPEIPLHSPQGFLRGLSSLDDPPDPVSGNFCARCPSRIVPDGVLTASRCSMNPDLERIQGAELTLTAL